MCSSDLTNATISVPAGLFVHCAKVVVSWTETAPDMQGSQRMVLYLAPSMGIIKREYWSNGDKWHEEVMTSYATDQRNRDEPLK